MAVFPNRNIFALAVKLLAGTLTHFVPALHDLQASSSRRPAPGARLNFGRVGQLGGPDMRCSKLPQVMGIILETSELLIINVVFEVSLIKNVRFPIKPPFSESRNLSHPVHSSNQPRVLCHWGFAIPGSVSTSESRADRGSHRIPLFH